MKITKQRLKEIIKEEIGVMSEFFFYNDAAGVTEPRYEGGTPEERLLNKLLIVSKVKSAPDAAAAAEMLGLGEDEEVIEYLDNLMGNPFYRDSSMEEGKVSSHRTEVTYSKEKRGKSKRPEKKAYNKAVRAQSKRDIKKGED